MMILSSFTINMGLFQGWILESKVLIRRWRIGGIFLLLFSRFGPRTRKINEVPKVRNRVLFLTHNVAMKVPDSYNILKLMDFFYSTSRRPKGHSKKTDLPRKQDKNPSKPDGLSSRSKTGITRWRNFGSVYSPEFFLWWSVTLWLCSCRRLLII